MKLLFHFDPTGTNRFNYQRYNKHFILEKDVVRIYIPGCQHKNVGNGVLFPDLNIIAENIFKCFNEKTFDLEYLHQCLGNDMVVTNSPDHDNKFSVDLIAIEGHSRGAVADLAVAQRLDELGIPMHLIVNQPVPGEISTLQRALSRYSDLTRCKNILSAMILLAAHDGPSNYRIFAQMLPQFASTTQLSTFLVPHPHHFAWSHYEAEPVDGQFSGLGNTSTIPYHIRIRLAELGFVQPVEDDKRYIKRWYGLKFDHLNISKNENGVPTLSRKEAEDVLFQREHTGAPELKWTSYSFLPPNFRQAIYNATVPLPEDPYYIEMLKENIEKYFDKELDLSLTDAQIKAIHAITQLGFEKNYALQLSDFLQQKNKKSEVFANITNQINISCEYLHLKQTNGGIKNQLSLFNKDLIESVYDHLNCASFTKEERQKLIIKINDAERQLREKALDQFDTWFDTFLKSLVEFITNLIGSSILQTQTGRWRLFNPHNQYVQIIENEKLAVLDQVIGVIG